MLINTNSIKIQKEKDFSKINEFLEHNFSSPTHWPDWNLIISKHFHTKFFYLGAYIKKKIIGICPVHETTHKRFLKKWHSGQFHFIPYGGWIFSDYISIRSKDIPIKYNVDFQSFCLPEISEFHIDYDNPRKFDKATLLIDLSKELEDLWNNELNSKRRQNIRKAYRSYIKVFFDEEPNIDLYHDFYKKHSFQDGVNLLSKEFFKNLLSHSGNIKFDLFWAVFNGNYISNLVVVYDKNYSMYLFGNNNKNISFMGQAELLQWEAIKSMKKKGCKYYDLCYIEPERLPNIYRFKKGFSKNEQIIHFLKKKPIFFKLLNKLL